MVKPISKKNFKVKLRNVTEILTLILSIIGACAWLPEVYRMVTFSQSKIEATLIDTIHINDFILGTQKRDGTPKKGELLVLAVNFFNEHKSIYLQDVSIEIILKDKSMKREIVREAVIGNRVNYNEGTTPMVLELPWESNIYNNQTLVSGENNIRIIPCLLEEVASTGVSKEITVDDIKEIKFSYQYNGISNSRKTINIDINSNQFSRPRFIVQYARERETGN